MDEPTRLLVTGGAGFIGSHVVDAFLGRGFAVAVLDAFVTGKLENVDARVTLYEVDVTNAAEVGRVLADFRPHVVDHHAGQISVSASAADPVADAQANVIGSLVVLEASRAHGVEHFIFASTGGALYGDPEHVPAGETAPVLPLSPYGAAKAAVETYLAMYRATWGLRYTALRYANVYGPRQTDAGEAGVIAIFAGRMLRGERPVIFGDGEQQRDFVYVADVASANVLAAECRIEGSYNVGTGIATSVNRIAALIAERCGYAGGIDHAPERSGEVRSITLDATVLTRTTAWSAGVGLEEGLTLTVEDRRGRLDVA